MSQSVAILGRQPALGLAELESLYGSSKIKALGTQAALLGFEPSNIGFLRLGGTVKIGRLLTILDDTDWNKIEQYLTEVVTKHTSYLPAGKMTLGISTYGLQVKPQQINATALSLKKLIKATGRSVRVVPNKTVDLSSAQVLHNDLTSPRAWELLFIRHSSQTYIAQTTHVQDIEAYAARDQARPKRDARVGMLPPKLAQIIINLAKPVKDAVVLDPFCGTGVVLQEALLMGYNVYGTDLDARMVEYSSKNVIDWFNMTVHPEIHRSVTIAQADATRTLWEKFDAIATETYLGRPFSVLPNPNVLNEVIKDVDTIHRKFLQNLARQTKPGFRMCIAIPAWKKSSGGFWHLPVLDSLEKLGYNRLSFVHTSNEDLIYHRENQVVGRELAILQRI